MPPPLPPPARGGAGRAPLAFPDHGLRDAENHPRYGWTRWNDWCRGLDRRLTIYEWNERTYQPGGWQLASGHDTTSTSTSASTEEEEGEEEWGRAEEAQARAMAADMRLHVEAGGTAVDCGDIYTGVG